jgi:hypothetical protein
MTTVAGTVASLVSLLDNLTVAPPAGAAVLAVTVPVDVPAPATVVGETVTVRRANGAAGGGETVSVVDTVTPPAVAEIVTSVGVETGEMEIGKLLADCPARKPAVAGTPATVGLLECKVAAKLFPTAGTEIDTVPRVTCDASVGFGPAVRAVASRAGSISSCPVTVFPANVAVRWTTVTDVTAFAVTGRCARFDPAGMTVLAGNASVAESLVSATVTPPGGAVAVSDASTNSASPLATTPGTALTDASEATAAGVTVTVNEALDVPSFTVTVTGVDAVTEPAVAAN